MAISRFLNKIEPLVEKGLPSLYVINNKLIQKGYYMAKLREAAKDATKFSNIKWNVIDKVILDLLSSDIFIQHELKHVFLTRPTFSKYTEVDELYWQVIGTRIPSKKEWNKLCMYQESEIMVDTSAHPLIDQKCQHRIIFNDPTETPKRRARCQSHPSLPPRNHISRLQAIFFIHEESPEF